jgi:hypothetical protein
MPRATFELSEYKVGHFAFEIEVDHRDGHQKGITTAFIRNLNETPSPTPMTKLAIQLLGRTDVMPGGTQKPGPHQHFNGAKRYELHYASLNL